VSALLDQRVRKAHDLSSCASLPVDIRRKVHAERSQQETRGEHSEVMRPAKHAEVDMWRHARTLTAYLVGVLVVLAILNSIAWWRDAPRAASTNV